MAKTRDDDDDDALDGRFVIKMDDHASFTGSNYDAIMDSTAVEIKRHSVPRPGSRKPMHPTNDFENKLAMQARETVNKGIKDGTLKVGLIDGKSITKLWLIVDEYDRLLAASKNETAADVPTDVATTTEPALESSAVTDVFTDLLMTLVGEEEDMGEIQYGIKKKPETMLGIQPVDQAAVGALAELQIAGLEFGKVKPPVNVVLTDVMDPEDNITFQANWVIPLATPKALYPSDLIFVADARTPGIGDYWGEMINTLGHRSGIMRLSWKDNPEVGSLDVLLPARSFQFGIFNFLWFMTE